MNMWRRRFSYIKWFILFAVFSSCAPKPIEKTGLASMEIISTPLVNETDLTPLIKEFGRARIVVIGDASHGTSEFYLWRAALTKRLITEKEFNVVAVEGDWNDCFEVNKYIKTPGADSGQLINVLRNFNRFPTWLWRNEETAGFLKWLHDLHTEVSFYGLDIFSITENLTILANSHDTAIKNAALNALQCFHGYSGDEPSYTLANAPTECSAAFVALEKAYAEWNKRTPTEIFYTANVFRSAIDGEKYYHLARTDRAAAWNLRDGHMANLINALAAKRDNKIVVWVHNTHSGDAHYSEMSSTGQTNVGELLRKYYGREVYLVGTATYKGEVIAAKTWGGPAEVMKLPAAGKGSVESILHEQSVANRIILSKNIQNHPLLKTWTGQRAIGAVYRKGHELYVPSVIPRRYDALIFIDSTHALHPLN
jgi:erythromycin esterase